MPNDQLKRRILVGADPELFLTDIRTGKLVSAHDKLPGTKEKPYKVDYGAVQVDGVAAEFNIDPASEYAAFHNNIKQVMSHLQTIVGVNYKLTTIPIAVFDKSYWDTLPGDVKILGCNPDFNGWTGDRNPPPNGDTTLMRTASGHLHCGWIKNQKIDNPDHMVDCGIVARQLDYWLGLASLIWDADTKRRSMYGKAGTFRPKPYGVEYRVLSNQWLKDPYLIKFVYNQTYVCMKNILEGGNLLEETYGDLAREVIDNSIPWFDDAKSKVWKVMSAVGVDVGSLLKFKDPAWLGKKEETKAEETPKKKRSTKANFYKKAKSIDELWIEQQEAQLVATEWAVNG